MKYHRRMLCFVIPRNAVGISIPCIISHKRCHITLDQLHSNWRRNAVHVSLVWSLMDTDLVINMPKEARSWIGASHCFITRLTFGWHLILWNFPSISIVWATNLSKSRCSISVGSLFNTCMKFPLLLVPFFPLSVVQMTCSHQQDIGLKLCNPCDLWNLRCLFSVTKRTPQGEVNRTGTARFDFNSGSQNQIIAYGTCALFCKQTLLWLLSSVVQLPYKMIKFTGKSFNASSRYRSQSCQIVSFSMSACTFCMECQGTPVVSSLQKCSCLALCLNV